MMTMTLVKKSFAHTDYRKARPYVISLCFDNYKWYIIMLIGKYWQKDIHLLHLDKGKHMPGLFSFFFNKTMIMFIFLFTSLHIDLHIKEILHKLHRLQLRSREHKHKVRKHKFVCRLSQSIKTHSAGSFSIK